MGEIAPLARLKRLATSTQGAPELATIGRFELRRKLGQGAQSQVWLAFDPRLEREVAIKLMKPVAASNASVLASWLQEARSVSRLNHPAIVPVFEADVQGQQPYLVFEYVAGQTLAQLLASQGALAPVQAVTLMQEILSALTLAHSAGVVHRDLKPSNVLIDAKAHARVTDFGIAARFNAPGLGADLLGTPAYMSPEAARGEAVSPLFDVYGAGLVLAEMLSGKSLAPDADVYRTLNRVAHEPLQLPPELLAALDDALRAVVLRATAFDPRQRWPGAQEFLQSLREWSDQRAASALAPQVGAVMSPSGTLEFLLRRMRNKSDFPALSESIVRIQSMATSEKESISSVTNEILKDVALTNKLLRLVNSAHYARGNSIGTVSRAVSLVGFNAIRNMALSLVLLEHMQDRSNANLLKDEFLRALMAGSIAAEFGGSEEEGEKAFIGAMFQNLGRMLSQFYFPEEAASIRDLVSSGNAPLREEAASTKVLGISFETLGLGVAKAWGLPEGIQHCIVRPVGEPPSQMPKDAPTRLRWSARAANDMAHAMLHEDPLVVERDLAQAAKRYGKALGLSANHIHGVTLVARKKLIALAQAMEITVRADSPVAHLLKAGIEVKDSELSRAVQSPDGLATDELQASQVVSLNSLEARQKRELTAQTLAAGIQDITNSMVEDFKLSDVLRMILEAMFRALDFHRIVFCMRDSRTNALTGRFGLGAGIESVVKRFNVPLQPTGMPDLFSTICNKGADTLIRDTSDQRIAERLPPWYQKDYAAPTFLILPLLLKGKPFGLIYADKSEPDGLQVDEKELAMLRTLRNQAVMAFRQSN